MNYVLYIINLINPLNILLYTINMLSFFYIFALLNLCIKAEVCSTITISDSDDIIINKDSPFVGFDKSFFSGYNKIFKRILKKD